jgi:hypothetical protein
VKIIAREFGTDELEQEKENDGGIKALEEGGKSLPSLFKDFQATVKVVQVGQQKVAAALRRRHRTNGREGHW